MASERDHRRDLEREDQAAHEATTGPLGDPDADEVNEGSADGYDTDAEGRPIGDDAAPAEGVVEGGLDNGEDPPEPSEPG